MLNSAELAKLIKVLGDRTQFYFADDVTIISKDSDLLAFEIYSKYNQLVTFNPRMDNEIIRPPSFVLTINTTDIAKSIELLPTQVVGTPYRIVINHKRQITTTRSINYRFFDLFGTRYYIDTNSKVGSIMTIEPNNVSILYASITPKGDRLRPIAKRSSKLKRTIFQGLIENLTTLNLSQYKPQYVEPPNENSITELR